MSSLAATDSADLITGKHWEVIHQGKKWIRFNYDTGAATTALPVELADGQKLTKVGEFVVASGDDIPNYGPYKFDTKDEFGNRRKVKGSITEVHKPLGAGCDLSTNHDAMIWKDGGALIPKWSPVAIGLKKEYERLTRWYGKAGILPLYREGNLYNYYLEKLGDLEIANVDQGSQEGQAASSSSGNQRQAKWASQWVAPRRPRRP